MKEAGEQQLPLFEMDLSSMQPAIATHAVASLDADSPFSKYIVYVDESGDHGMQTVDEQYPLFAQASRHGFKSLSSCFRLLLGSVVRIFAGKGTA